MQTAWRSTLPFKPVSPGRFAPKRGGLSLRRLKPTPSRSAAKKRGLRMRAVVDPVDRALGSAPYLLPLLDGLKYGAYVFNSYPVFARVLSPIFPLYELYTSIPLGSLIIFFGLYLGIARNVSFSRFVRFNAMQAILIDILLILPGFLIQVLRLSSEFRVPLYNVTWMYVFCCTALAIMRKSVHESALTVFNIDFERLSMANVYCASRPRYADGPQTPLYKELQDYAHSVELQGVMQEMMTELLIAQPEEPIPFMIAFLERKRGATSNDAKHDALPEQELKQ